MLKSLRKNKGKGGKRGQSNRTVEKIRRPGGTQVPVDYARGGKSKAIQGSGGEEAGKKPEVQGGRVHSGRDTHGKLGEPRPKKARNIQ